MSARCKKVEPNNEIDKILCKNVTTWNKGFVELGEEKFIVPERYTDIADQIENFEVRDSDIFVTSFPRSGTTWLQEMVWMIYNLDYERGKTPLVYRFPFLESSCLWNFENTKTMLPHLDFKGDDSVSFAANLDDTPRFIKTHVSWDLLPLDIRENRKKPKIIHVVRNPRDSCVSYFHFLSIRGYEKCSIEDFCKLFLSGRLVFSPYWANVMGYWKRRNEDNILFLHYEDMKKDLRSAILQVANFLGKALNEDDIKKLLVHLSFENMKKNSGLDEKDKKTEIMKDISDTQRNPEFFRKGVVGGYKDDMPVEMIKLFDDWIHENTKDIDLVV